MPIKKENRKYYGPKWQKLSRWIRSVRAGNTCEWCHARNHEPHPVTGSKVVLTVAHFNQTPGDDRPENLVALCQRCHLALDREQHTHSAKETRLTKKDDARPLISDAVGN